MSSVQSATQSSSAGAAASLAAQAPTAAATQDQFLKLLVAQLNNQDPLNPMDSAQITSQMAQISTVSGIEQLNATLQSLTSQNNTASQIQSAALVGHTVLTTGSSIALSGGSAAAGFSLDQAVDQLTVSIKDSNGNVVHTVNLGAQQAGQHTFQWDGTADNGQSVPEGTYTFSVTALAAGQPVQPQALEVGNVIGILPGSAGTTLDLGSMGTAQLSDVKQIF